MTTNLVQAIGRMLIGASMLAAPLLILPTWAQESDSDSSSSSNRDDDDDEEGTSGTGSSSGTRSSTRHTGSDERTGRIGSPSGTSRAGSDGTGPGGAGSRSTSGTSRGDAARSSSEGRLAGTSRDDDDEEGTSGAGSTSGTRSSTRHTGSDERTGRIGSPSGTSRAGSDGTGPSGAGSRSTPGTSRGNARGSRDTARNSSDEPDRYRENESGYRESGRSGSRAGIGRSDSDYTSGRDRARTSDRIDRSSRESDERYGSRDRSPRDDDQYSTRNRSNDDEDRYSGRERLPENLRETARSARETVRDARDMVRDTRENVARNVGSLSREFDPSTARPADIGIWFNRSTDDGLTIRDVSTSGPIAQLNFREGDRIVSIEGYRVNSEREFMQDLFREDYRDQRVSVVIDRNGTQRTIQVEPSVLIEHTTTVQTDLLETFGLVLDDRHPDQLVVWRVLPRSSAFYAGVRSGDVITAWDNTRMTSKEDLEQALQNASEGEEVNLTIYRGQEPRQIEAEIPRLASSTESTSGRRTSYRPRLDDESDLESTSTENRPLRVHRPGLLPRPGILPRNR